jgi:hypothetical protein
VPRVSCEGSKLFHTVVGREGREIETSKILKSPANHTIKIRMKN